MHLETAKRDLTYVTDRRIPAWVDGALYGTVIIFISFAFVQIIYQRELTLELLNPHLHFSPGVVCWQAYHLDFTSARSCVIAHSA